MTLQLLARSPESRTVRRLADGYVPRSELGKEVVKALRYLPRDVAEELLDKLRSTLVVESSLSLRVFRYHGLVLAGLLDPRESFIEEHGVVSRKVVTTAGVNYLAGAFNNANEPENFKYHAIGTGSTAENIADTGLVTELTTEYNPNSTRATGSQANSTNTYTTIGTNTLDSGTPTIQEHAIMSQAATGGGTCWDRSVFTGIALVGANGDALQSTYVATFTAGG